MADLKPGTTMYRIAELEKRVSELERRLRRLEMGPAQRAREAKEAQLTLCDPDLPGQLDLTD